MPPKSCSFRPRPDVNDGASLRLQDASRPSLSAPDCQRIRHPHEVSERFRAHLPHYVAAMELYGDLGHSEFGSSLLVEETASYPLHDLLFAMCKSLELCP